MENKIQKLKEIRKNLIKERKDIEFKIKDINNQIAFHLEQENKKHPINNIISAVSEFYWITTKIEFWNNSKEHCLARYIIFYVLRNILWHTYSYIAQKTYCKSHATVLVSLRKTKINQMDKDFLNSLINSLWDYNNQKTTI